MHLMGARAPHRDSVKPGLVHLEIGRADHGEPHLGRLVGAREEASEHRPAASSTPVSTGHVPSSQYPPSAGASSSRPEGERPWQYGPSGGSNTNSRSPVPTALPDTEPAGVADDPGDAGVGLGDKRHRLQPVRERGLESARLLRSGHDEEPGLWHAATTSGAGRACSSECSRRLCRSGTSARVRSTSSPRGSPIPRPLSPARPVQMQLHDGPDEP